MTPRATDPQAGEGGNPMQPYQLHWLPSGEPWVFVPDPNTLGGDVPRDPLYFAQHLFKHARRRVRGDHILHDALPAKRQELFRRVVESSLNDLQAVTVEGALTDPEPRPGRTNDPSVDYLCAGRRVREFWKQRLVTAVVRQREVVTAPTQPIDGPVNVVITVTPRSQKWFGVLRGEPVTTDTTTHLLKPGQRFTIDEHCCWVRQPPHEIFGAPPPRSTDPAA